MMALVLYICDITSWRPLPGWLVGRLVGAPLGGANECECHLQLVSQSGYIHQLLLFTSYNFPPINLQCLVGSCFIGVQEYFCHQLLQLNLVLSVNHMGVSTQSSNTRVSNMSIFITVLTAMSPPTVTLSSSDNSCHNLFANPLTKTKVSLAENFVCLILRGDADTITFHAWPIMASRMEVDTQTRSSSDAVQIISFTLEPLGSLRI